jgi:hypothetical protein
LADERWAEITAPAFPGERLSACYNPLLAAERRRKRGELLQQTEARRRRLADEVARRRRRPLTQAQIAWKAGRLLQRDKVAKHFALTIGDGRLAWARRPESIQAEAQLDGIYVIRTSEPRRRLSAADGVRCYKRLGSVEQAFRCLKGLDLLVRPIYHRAAPRVRAHVLLCMLAYYVEWQLRQAWAPLLYEDEEAEASRRRRDPVAKAEASESAERKKRTHAGASGLEAHSFRTLLAALGTQTRNRCVVAGDESGATSVQVSEPTPLQAEALRLLGL